MTALLHEDVGTGTSSVPRVPPSASRRAGVRVEPLSSCVGRLLPILLPWLVVVVGRGVCIAAQRVPPLVWLVRAVRRELARRASEQPAGVPGGAAARPQG